MYMEIARKQEKRGIRTDVWFSTSQHTTWQIGWISLNRVHYPRRRLGWSLPSNDETWIEARTHWTFKIERPERFA
jgi:hypothetical protein